MTLRFNGLDPHKHTALYYNGKDTFYARSYGAAVKDNFSTSPTLYFYPDSGGDEQAYIWSSSTHFYIKNRTHGGEVRITGENLAGDQCNLLIGDPDLAVKLYHQDTLAARTTDWAPGDTPGAGSQGGIEAISPDGNYALCMTRDNGTSGTLFLKGYGDYLRIGGEDSGGGAASSIVCVPHSYTEIRHDEVKVFRTDAEGIDIHDSSGSNPVIALREDDGTLIGELSGVSGLDMRVQCFQTGGDAWLAARTEGSNWWVGITAGGTFHPSPDDAISCGKSTNVWTDVYATSGSVNTSDLRKKNIVGSSLGLEFISKLRPVTYIWKKGHRPHQGLIAQDVKKAMVELGIKDFAGYIDPYVTEFPEGEDAWKPERQGDSKPHLGLRYHEFIAPLISAVQELKTEVDQLKKSR